MKRIFHAALHVCLATLAAQVHAGDAFPVAYTGVEYFDTARSRPVAATIWYPAAAGAQVVPVRYDWSFRGQAAPCAAYAEAGAPRPLVLLSHGDKGSAVDQSWLAEALAADGYIVAAAAHWMNTWRRNTPEQTLRVWDRPQDLSYLLDALLADPVWGARIDAGRIGAAGHSSGGYTVLALAGAVYDPLRMAAYCGEAGDAPDCRLRDGVDVARIDWSGAGKSYRDPRVRAVLAMAPALGPGIVDASLGAIDVPVQIVAAADDEVLRFERHAARYAAAIPNARLLRLPQGGHFAFMPQCTVVTWALTYFMDYDVCGRRSGVDRAPLRARIAQDALSFFGNSLAPS
ncbi:MAG: alpha/beta hydrolase family protein [Gammaproteobacteria bacterium]